MCAIWDALLLSWLLLPNTHWGGVAHLYSIDKQPHNVTKCQYSLLPSLYSFQLILYFLFTSLYSLSPTPSLLFPTPYSLRSLFPRIYKVLYLPMCFGSKILDEWVHWMLHMAYKMEKVLVIVHYVVNECYWVCGQWWRDSHSLHHHLYIPKIFSHLFIVFFSLTAAAP